MKKYKRGRTSEEFLRAANSHKMIQSVDTSDYQKGGDYIKFQFIFEDEVGIGLFNVVNARVLIQFQGQRYDTDQNLDGLPWFDAILELANTNDPRPAIGSVAAILK